MSRPRTEPEKILTGESAYTGTIEEALRGLPIKRLHEPADVRPHLDLVGRKGVNVLRHIADPRPRLLFVFRDLRG